MERSTLTDHAHAQAVKLSRGYLLIKRGFDVLVATCGLIILALPLAIIAVLIKLDDSSGPVFYSQMRVGLHGQEFRMWKLRSMVTHADQMVAQLAAHNEINGAMFKIKDDPRITKVGHFIRKHSIDELPQLYNVLKGDMSLVGPRPALPQEVANYTTQDKQRMSVLPGATGLWQVSGRSDVSFDEMIQLDLQYIRSASVWFDLRIILKTFVIFIRPNGAY